MQIIGHRGAAGLALENTLQALRTAMRIGVDAIEFDLQMTRDRQLVLCHDPNLSRVSYSKAKIDNLDLAELKKIKLKNGEFVPTLEEALNCLGKTPAIIDVKVEDCATELLEVIDKFPKADITVASFKHRLVEEVKQRRPNQKTYLIGFIGPSETFKTAKRIGADGLDLNIWALNPITYSLAHRAGMDIMVYAVDYPLVARFIRKFYPEVSVCTNYPDRFLKSRPKAKGRT